MPELPEVESLKLSLEPFLLGKTITDVQINNAKIVTSKGTTRLASESKKKEFTSGLLNQTFIKIERRAKNLIFYFKSGKIILVHLKMTGQLVYQDDQSQVSGGHPIHNLSLPGKHTHIIFTLNKGILYYNDVRQFGYVLYYPSQKDFDLENHFKDIGPEPFDQSFTAKYLLAKFKTKNLKLKSALMAQAIVTGLGNIYCDEVCFASGVLPTRSTKSITKKESQTLYQNINSILKNAISLGGSSISDYLLADGSRGNYAREHKVYGRGGQPCLVCQTILKTTKLGSRTTVYCRQCQH